MNKRSRHSDYTRRAQKREKDNGAVNDNSEIRDLSSQGWSRYHAAQIDKLPQRITPPAHKRLIRVFVEGYEDVSFWRGIFDHYESEHITFEVNVPPREDLAKGKKVLMGMIPQSSPSTLLCVDSDFDHLFGESTPQSRTILSAKYMFHTYAYATENYLCYAPSLHNVCVKATKNDTRIFDFEKFMAEYSRIIYPLFIWYSYSAHLANENLFTLLEFKSSVKLNYLEVEHNGRGTLGWLERQVRKRCASLEEKNRMHEAGIKKFEELLLSGGFEKELTYMYMQGHTLMDNVVIVMLNAVCDQLKLMCNVRISTSTKTGTALKNEQSNYNNSLRDVRQILLDNESYKESPQYRLLQQDIESFLATI